MYCISKVADMFILRSLDMLSALALLFCYFFLSHFDTVIYQWTFWIPCKVYEPLKNRDNLFKRLAERQFNSVWAHCNYTDMCINLTHINNPQLPELFLTEWYNSVRYFKKEITRNLEKYVCISRYVCIFCVHVSPFSACSPVSIDQSHETSSYFETKYNLID